jgi:uncharacterized membrane protein YkoI
MLKLKRIWVAFALVAPLVVSVGSADAANKRPARLTMEAARATALNEVKGRVVHQELEKEHGRWIFSFEIRPTGQRGPAIKEVNIDARTGHVISVEDEPR